MKIINKENKNKFVLKGFFVLVYFPFVVYIIPYPYGFVNVY